MEISTRDYIVERNNGLLQGRRIPQAWNFWKIYEVVILTNEAITFDLFTSSFPPYLGVSTSLWLYTICKTQIFLLKTSFEYPIVYLNILLLLISFNQLPLYGDKSDRNNNIILYIFYIDVIDAHEWYTTNTRYYANWRSNVSRFQPFLAGPEKTPGFQQLTIWKYT